jgi:hypothetical protein
VAIDGQPTMSNFDIWAAAGATNKAVIKEFSVKADRYGLIMIDFLVGAVNLPSLRGIELIETAPPTTTATKRRGLTAKKYRLGPDPYTTESDF